MYQNKTLFEEHVQPNEYLDKFILQLVDWQALSLFQYRLFLFLSKRRLRAAEYVTFPLRHVHRQHVATRISSQQSCVI